MASSIGTLRQTRDEVLNIEWEIGDFLSLSGFTGTSYASPSFQFSDSHWYLEICPYGQISDDTDTVALYLWKRDAAECSSTEIVAFQLGIKRADGTTRLSNTITWKFDENKGYGWKNFTSRLDLLRWKADLLPSEALIISGYFKKVPSSKGLNTLASDFEKILMSTNYSDVTIKVKNVEYKAHKVILAARSSVFAAMFEHEMTEKNSSIVDIKDCDPTSFKYFLSYLYTGRAEITESNVSDLYMIADKYIAEELKSQCVAFIMQNLSVDNICDVASFGDHYSEHGIIHISRDFFRSHMHNILLTEQWEALMKDNYQVANSLLKYGISNLKI